MAPHVRRSFFPVNTILLTTGAVAIAFSATQALAAPAPASPKQPIPYSQLSTYLKASPKQQATKDWSAAAAMGAGVNTSATTAATPSLHGDIAVTSACFSPLAEAILGLGYVRRADLEAGYAFTDPLGEFTGIKIVPRPYYDPGKRRPRTAWRA